MEFPPCFHGWGGILPVFSRVSGYRDLKPSGESNDPKKDKGGKAAFVET